MQNIEEKIFENSPCWPIFWYRYVDDILTALPSNEIDNFKQHINSINSNIQFVSETEIDAKISYLDMNIKRNEDDSLSSGVNRNIESLQTQEDIWISIPAIMQVTKKCYHVTKW